MSQHDLLKEVKQAVATGSLTAAEAERRLRAAVEKEYGQDRPRSEWINACEDLLWELRTGGKTPFTSQREEHRALIRAHTRDERRQSWPVWLKGCVVAAALMLVVGLGAHFGRTAWITGQSSPDGQQYVFTGHEIDLSVIQRVIAEHGSDAHLQTESLDEVVAFLGFRPELPDMSGLDVQRTAYTVHIEDSLVEITVLYARDPQARNVIYSCTHFLNAEDVYYTIEQNEEGVTERIAGQDVYFCMNYERLGVAWTEGLTTYVIGGGIDHETGRKIVEKMLK